METKTFEEWAILELMGHRKLAGKISEATIGGASFVRIDIPEQATQFYNPAAVYCITPTSEELCMKVAKRYLPAPITTWDLPREPEGAEEALESDEF